MWSTDNPVERSDILPHHSFFSSAGYLLRLATDVNEPSPLDLHKMQPNKIRCLIVLTYVESNRATGEVFFFLLLLLK